MTVTHSILRIALPTPLRRLFDYLPVENMDTTQLMPGIRVRVPFRNRSLIGILVSLEKESNFPIKKLKSAIEYLDETPIIPPDLFTLCQWAARYYHCSLGEMLNTAIPPALRKGKPAFTKKKSSSFLTSPNQIEALPCLNADQVQAVDKIIHAKKGFKTFLLDGVTGSGKTEVYLRIIANVLAEQKQVLVLVPEISLTPQTIQRFRARFSVPMTILHSGLSEGERLASWLAIRSGEIKLVIGTRSAVFTSFFDLGLIIVDEEHDNSYKQQEKIRYHARDVAVMRASQLGIPLILGSATPSLESLLNVKRQRYEGLSLPTRAGNANLPTFEMIDIKRTPLQEGISLKLLDAIRQQLNQDNQVLLFLNRRGFAPVFYCTQCAWMAHCQRCDATLVYHQSPKRLRCHHCDLTQTLPAHCEACHEPSLAPVGMGTQRLEQSLSQVFPGIPILRLDRDNTKNKGEMAALIDNVHSAGKAILLGTQMLAKGHHFPKVTLVGVMDADAGLFSADFRSAEQVGQLMMQVSGRAGRADKPGHVMLQTRYPDHSLLTTLIQKGYSYFAQQLLIEREQAMLPPYTYLAIIRAESYAPGGANEFLEAIKTTNLDEVTFLGPVPALLAKKKGLYCEHLLIQSTHRVSLAKGLATLVHRLEGMPLSRTIKWSLDVDPISV